MTPSSGNSSPTKFSAPSQLQAASRAPTNTIYSTPSGSSSSPYLHHAIPRPPSRLPLSRPLSTQFDQSHLLGSLGKEGEGALLAHEKTLDLYRSNAKRSPDPNVQFEFARFLISTALSIPVPPGSASLDTLTRSDSGPIMSATGPRQLLRKSQSTASSESTSSSASIHSAPSVYASEDQSVAMSSASSSQKSGSSVTQMSPAIAASNIQRRDHLVKEATTVLRKLADRSYPDAQYLLGDALSSGILGRRDLREAFILFVAAAKHGHVEAAYRSALCYEEGWGTATEPRKAVQFLRAAAAKNHPGATLKLGVACFYGRLGLHNQEREGIKWLSRATEVANEIFPEGPYELAGIYETGYSDIIIQDDIYAAQLYVKSADLGYAPAAARLGHAYEVGDLKCPVDPALSVHYYTIAALAGDASSMLALCAWYMVGAPPLLEQSEEEAYEWAHKAAEAGYPKAMFAVGHFYEAGIGTSRDLLEANVWYVRAAERGEERAKARLKTLNERPVNGVTSKKNKSNDKLAKKDKNFDTSQNTPGKLKRAESDKDRDCVVM
ncbi:uncharacterized protein V1518DRAFT_369035 [Limtongia smithiae]|uniref:uncharacterized protein n=1 Tax=Limtongia smithiae TaxID=1125753 RepID=UPI0034CE3AC5